MSRLPRHCRPLGGAFNPVDFQQRLLWVDSVEKVLCGAHAHFLKAAMRLTPLDAGDQFNLRKIAQRSP
jgi:hypothetical protein